MCHILPLAVMLLSCPRDVQPPSVAHRQWPARLTAETSFGLDNSFSGQLSEEQERLVPKALRGAFMIESLQEITATELAKQAKVKTQLAEEMRNGKRHVALRDFRGVHFPNGAHGMMIVIERYVLVPEMTTNDYSRISLCSPQCKSLRNRRRPALIPRPRCQGTAGRGQTH